MTKPKGPITGQAKSALNLKAGATNWLYAPEYPSFTPSAWRQHQWNGTNVSAEKFHRLWGEHNNPPLRDIEREDWERQHCEPSLLERLEAELALRPNTVETTD